MKKIIPVILLLTLIISGSMQAAVLNVDNKLNSGAPYTSVQAAVNAASTGDTVYINGSPTGYDPSGVYLRKRLTLIGAGYHPQKDLPNPSSISTLIVDSVSGSGSSGSVIMGLQIQSFSASTNNLLIKRNQISSQISISYSSNLVFSQNCCTGGLFMQYSTNSLISNNLFFNSGDFSGSTFIIFSNNTFLSYYYGMNNINQCLLSNNIFYYARPNVTNSTFTNNLIFGTSSDVLPYGTNSGSGNFNGQDPLFVYVPNYGVLDFSFNYRIQSGSPGHLAGTDGTDIGAFGGADPLPDLTGMPSVPQITQMTIFNDIVQPGSNINVSFKARKNN